MDEVRLLHIADVHLGGSGPAFGNRVRQHQKRLMDAFARCVEEAILRRADVLLIAGDLFDSPRPTDRTADEALGHLRRLSQVSPPIPCVILPGTHDCLQKACVYDRLEFSAEGLHVLRQSGHVVLAEGRLAVHGNPQHCGEATHRPLLGLQPDPGVRWNVALAHGSLVRPGITDNDSSLIAGEDIEHSAMDYVALGHWHQHSDQTRGKVPAAYSGSPEVVGVDEEAGGALLVTLSPAGARWERLATWTLRSQTVQLDVAELGSEAAVAQAVRTLADPDLLLSVRLTGLAPEGYTCDVVRLQEELGERFFRLRIRDETAPSLAEPAAEGAEQRLVAARALAALRARMEEAQAQGDAEAERVARQAFQLAAALFQGREVLG